MKYTKSISFNTKSFILISLFICNNHERTVTSANPYNISAKELEIHRKVIQEYFSKRKDWVTSNLGSILFKNADPRYFVRKHENRTFMVSVRSFHIEETIRFFNYPGTPLDSCSVKNCRFQDMSDHIEDADAVIIIIRNGMQFIPQKRNPRQIWILFSEESPIHTISSEPRPDLERLSNVFNWTMTFRSDSDIPVPYGRTAALESPVDVDLTDVEGALAKLVPYWDKKQFSVLATIIMSNCEVPGRNTVLSQLRQHMNIDGNGRCFIRENPSFSKCRGVFVNAELRPDCPNTESYIFYLALENSRCRQYLTEKCFHHAYAKGAIPVISGPPLEDCKKLLPPNSFLHVDSYKTIKDLANHMVDIFHQWETLLSFHAWRKHFIVTNDHGYFKTDSQYYCRVCEALNYNDGEQKSYDADDLGLHLDKRILCEESYNKEKILTCPKKNNTTKKKVNKDKIFKEIAEVISVKNAMIKAMAAKLESERRRMNKL